MKAGMNTNRQNFRNLLSASGTELRRARRIDLYHFSLSLCRYLRESGKEQSPRSVANASGEMAVAYHALNVQIFDSNPLVVTGVMIRQLEDEILALIGNLFVKMSNDLLCLLSAIRAKLLTGKGALFPTKIRQRRFQEPGIVGNKPVRVNGKGLNPNINTDSFLSDGKTADRDFITRERYKPFSRRSTPKGYGFDFAFDGTREEEFESSNTVYRDMFLVDHPTSVPQCDCVVTILSLESREARLLSCLDSAKKRPERPIKNFQWFLKRGRGNVVLRNVFPKLWQLVNLIVESKRFLSSSVVTYSLLKRYVVEQAQRFNPCFCVSNRPPIGDYAVLE